MAAANAQAVDIKKIKEMNFYGVDFSLASAPDVAESPELFKSGITKINHLLYLQVKKFNFQRYMGKRILAYNFDVTDNRNADIDAQLLTSRTVREKISEAEIQEIISSLSTENAGAAGCVFIAETLSKTARSGTYYVVFFDESTKQIIYSKRVKGKAGGFGVRNYWAASILSILKTWNWR